MTMKKLLISALVLLLAGWSSATAQCEDGSRLWLRLDTTNAAKAVTGVKGTAMTAGRKDRHLCCQRCRSALWCLSSVAPAADGWLDSLSEHQRAAHVWPAHPEPLG